MNLSEIKSLASVCHKNNISTEVFVHGSNCISFSGICYISSVHGGNSGNRGRCSQPCRDQYFTTPKGINYPLNLKDNSAYFDMKNLIDAGVDTLKIEGRIKKFHYVYTVVKSWKEQQNLFHNNKKLNTEYGDLLKIFNRGYSNSYLHGKIDKDMFIDNPRDNSAKYFHEQDNQNYVKNLEIAKKEIYDLRTDIIKNVRNKIDILNIEKIPLTITISGSFKSKLKLEINLIDRTLTIESESPLTKLRPEAIANNKANNLDEHSLIKIFNVINNTEYNLAELNLKDLQGNLYISTKELNAIKKHVLHFLKDNKEWIAPIEPPLFKKQNTPKAKPLLSVLISTEKDISLCKDSSINYFYQLPNILDKVCIDYIDLFKDNKNILPWFPSILIGKSFDAAVEILKQVKPRFIVTNNLGVAYTAFQMNIPWIGGPFLNIVNSYSLLCLKERYNCIGAFISNEINRKQIERINCPDDFKLFYSIYHPIELLSSRQCLFHQITGCKKSTIDNICIDSCIKSSTITNMKNIPLQVIKSKNNYNSIYNNINFLNTDIVIDIPNLFNSYLIDLRDVSTETKICTNKLRIIETFKKYLDGNLNLEDNLKKDIFPSTNIQYQKGI